MKSLKFATWSFAFLVFMSLLRHGNALPFSYTTKVAIKDLTGSDIIVHCESKDDNIGTHTLHNNDILRWKFKPDIEGNTLFWCSFVWPTPEKTLDAKFIVWDWNTAPVFDFVNNSWKVQKDGFILYDVTISKWVHRHNWGFHEAKLEALPEAVSEGHDGMPGDHAEIIDVHHDKEQPDGLR